MGLVSWVDNDFYSKSPFLWHTHTLFTLTTIWALGSLVQFKPACRPRGSRHWLLTSHSIQILAGSLIYTHSNSSLGLAFSTVVGCPCVFSHQGTIVFTIYCLLVIPPPRSTCFTFLIYKATYLLLSELLSLSDFPNQMCCMDAIFLIVLCFFFPSHTYLNC